MGLANEELVMSHFASLPSKVAASFLQACLLVLHFFYKNQINFLCINYRLVANLYQASTGRLQNLHGKLAVSLHMLFGTCG